MKKNSIYRKRTEGYAGRVLFIISIFVAVSLWQHITVCAGEKEPKKQMEISPESLYAHSAVLMDGSSGRILYEKQGEEFLANASTTKILTCILALEHASLDDVVQVSSYAASMPNVQLHIREGEEYYLKDLLYSLMLESHNDVAVAIAEHISKTQEEFSGLMNQKAKEIGCKNTNFLTPNGLDAVQKVGNREETHGTTAADLALIMRYCIHISSQKEQFLLITQTTSHEFFDVHNTRHFICRNHNSLFNYMEGVVSGKTGFTAKAGYCYVGALERNGKCYIVALLACGWPGNKNYKWADCRKLLEYGLKEYELCDLKEVVKKYENKLVTEVRNAKREEMGKNKVIPLKKENGEITKVLLKAGEGIEVKIKKKEATAPLKAGETLGEIIYYISGEKLTQEELYCCENIEKIDFMWCLWIIMKKIV